MPNKSETPANVEDVGQPKREASLAAPNGYAAVLEEVYQWLDEGPMDDWDERCRLHRKLGKMLGKKPTPYHE